MNRWSFPLIVITLIVAIGCDKNEDPGYPETPQIEFVDLTFDEQSPNGHWDSLVLTIHYRDGDRDLGLTGEEVDFPFHPINCFLENKGSLKPIGVEKRYFDLDQFFLTVDDGETRKLATIRSRKKAQYSTMPPFDPCHYLLDTTFAVSGEDKAIIDASYNIRDTLHSNSFPDVFMIKDSLYYEINENHFNILIEYLIEQPDGSFAPLDWQDQCDPAFTFKGRFPQITSTERIELNPFAINPESKWEGTLTWALKSRGFKIRTGDKKIKLRVKIKDRALHDSNVIETPVGTLESFMK